MSEETEETRLIKEMDLLEFWREGYLQEANRLFFHPLGLALALVLETDGAGEPMNSGRLVIGDWRDDPEGVLFCDSNPPERAKADTVGALRSAKAEVRWKRYGFEIQPIPGPAPMGDPAEPHDMP